MKNREREGTKESLLRGMRNERQAWEDLRVCGADEPKESNNRAKWLPQLRMQGLLERGPRA